MNQRSTHIRQYFSLRLYIYLAPALPTILNLLSQARAVELNLRTKLGSPNQAISQFVEPDWDPLK